MALRRRQLTAVLTQPGPGGPERARCRAPTRCTPQLDLIRKVTHERTPAVERCSASARPRWPSPAALRPTRRPNPRPPRAPHGARLPGSRARRRQPARPSISPPAPSNSTTVGRCRSSASAPSDSPRTARRRSVETALNAGYRLIDTARIYGNEIGVGRGITASGFPREEIFLTTKLRTDDFGRAAEAIDQSLTLLGVDYLDRLPLLRTPCRPGPHPGGEPMTTRPTTVLVVGATGSIGIDVVRQASPSSTASARWFVTRAEPSANTPPGSGSSSVTSPVRTPSPQRSTMSTRSCSLTARPHGKRMFAVDGRPARIALMTSDRADDRSRCDPAGRHTPPGSTLPSNSCVPVLRRSYSSPGWAALARLHRNVTPGVQERPIVRPSSGTIHARSGIRRAR